jgi:hypothetical protein
MPAGGPSKHPFGKQEARNQLGLSVASTQDTVEQFGTNLASQHHLKATHVAMGQCTGLHLEAVRRAQLQPAPGSGAAVGAGKPAPKVWQHSLHECYALHVRAFGTCCRACKWSARHAGCFPPQPTGCFQEQPETPEGHAVATRGVVWVGAYVS